MSHSAHPNTQLAATSSSVLGRSSTARKPFAVALFLGVASLTAGFFGPQAFAQDVVTVAPLSNAPVEGYPGTYTADQMVIIQITGPDALSVAPQGLTILGPAAANFAVDDLPQPSCDGLNNTARFPPYSCAWGIYFYGQNTPGTYTATLSFTYTDETTNVTATTTLPLSATILPVPTPSGSPNLSFVPLTTMFAGTGQGGYSGNNGLATSAAFNAPQDVVFDSNGNAYISDKGNEVIRKVDTTGKTTIFAGKPDGGGDGAYAGEGGLASAATLEGPGAEVLDKAGNLYFVDGFDAVRVINAVTGIVTTYAGPVVYNYGSAGDGGPATQALLYKPYGLVFDSKGNLYILEEGTNDIRKVDTSGIITTFAGKSTYYNEASGGPVNFDGFGGDGGPAASATFYFPFSLAIDSADDIYVADSSDDRVRVIDGSTTVINTVAGLGANISSNGAVANGAEATPALMASFYAGAVALDPVGNYYIADGFPAANVGAQIYKVDGKSGIITQFPSLNATQYAGFLKFDPAGALYIMDQISSTVYRVAAQGVLAFGNENVGTTSAAQFLTLQNNGSSAVTFNTTPYTVVGNFAVGDGGTCSFSASLAVGATCTVAVTFTPQSDGALTGTISFASNSTASPLVASLSGFGLGGAPMATLTPSPVAFGNQTVNTTSGVMVATLSNTGTGALTGITVSLAGTDPGDFADTSACGTTLATNSSCNISVTFTPASAASFTATLSVADNATGSPQTASLTGTGTPVASTPPTLAPAMLTFAAVAVGSGDDSMFATLTNPGTTAVTGITVSFTGTNAGDFSTYPSGTCGTSLAANSSCTIAVRFYPTATGARTGTLNVAQSGTAQPLTVALSGNGLPAPVSLLQFYPSQLNYVAGDGQHPPQCNDTGDNGPATSAMLCQPYGAAVDAAGNTYMVDFGDNVVKKIDTNGIITTYAGVESLQGGFSGDGGLATAATLNAPVGIAFDANGNGYISDANNGRIREVDATTGIITTFVGGAAGGFTSGTSGTAVALIQPGGLTFDPSGNLYIAVTGQQIVAKVTPAALATIYAGVIAPDGTGVAGYNGDRILATTAELNSPQQVSSDRSGDIYIADTGNFRVRYVDPASGTIYTAAGNGTQGDTGDGGLATSAEINAVGVAVDLGYNLYISDGSSIRKVNGDTGDILTVAGGGTGGVGGAATSASISVGLPAIGNLGNVLIPDALNTQAALLSEGSIGYLQFGSEVVNSTTSAMTVTIFSVGSLNFDFENNNIYTATGDFAVTGGTCFNEEGPGAGGCTLTVTFTPTAIGVRTGSIVFAGISAGDNTILLTGTGTAVAAPVASLSPTTVAFGNQTVLTTSTSQMVTLSNTGNADLTGIVVSLTGTNPGDFADTSACGTTLAAGSSCNISVTFTPATAASFAATLSVADNASGSPQTAALTGTGTAAAAPIASLSPATVAFGNQTVSTTSTAQTVTLSNTGNAALTSIVVSLTGTNPGDFADTSACGTTLAAGASCNISVTFTPATAASFAATLSVADNASGSPQTASLTGTGTAAPAPIASLSPATVAFGNQTVLTTSTSQMVTLSNTGNASLTGITVSLTGTNPGDFADTSACGTTLAAGASCNISVTFTPATAASFAATLSVADNATGSPQTASLTGTGTAAPAPIASLSPATVAFGNQTVLTTSTSQTVTLSNTGNASLTGITVSLTGTNPGDFADTTACGTTLAAGASCNISVTFTPASAASFAATLSVADNASGSPQTASLTGTGTAVAAPIATLSPTTITFPTTPVNSTSASQTLTLSNTGNAALAIGSVSIAGANPTEFADTSACGSSLAAGASCTISVTFTPDSANSFTATLSVADNASSSPQIATLNGTGMAVATDFGLAATPAALSVPAGTLAQFALNLTGVGGDFNLPVVLTVTGVPPGSTASFSPATVTPGSSAASVLSVATPLLIGELRTPSSKLPLLALLLLPLLGLRKLRKKLPRAVRLLTIGLLACAALLPLSGCGGGYFGDKPQTVTLTITGTSGALQHATTVTLTIQ